VRAIWYLSKEDFNWLFRYKVPRQEYPDDSFAGDWEMIGDRKSKAALAVCLLVILILAGSNVLLFNRNLELHNQMDSIPGTYFFLQDPELSNSSGLETWRCGFRHLDPLNTSDRNIARITSGTAHLCYNETSGLGWSTASLSQGDLPNNWGDRAKNYSLLLGGCNQKTGNPTSGVTFYRYWLPGEGEFLLKSRIRIVRREFLANATNDVPKNNVGIVLYCSYTQTLSNCTSESDYFNSSKNVSSAIYIDIFFASSIWNDTTSELEPTRYEPYLAHGDPWEEDYVIGLTIEDPVELEGVWRNVTADLGRILNLTFDYLPDTINLITVRGAQIFVESIGCLIEAEIDYVRMAINN